jgi:hypothetical protein
MQGKPVIYVSKCWMDSPNISRRQERTHLDPMSREDTPRSWSGEDTPGSYVRRGHASILCQERTRLDPMSDEDSGHASILVRRGQRTHLDPSQERIEYTFTLHIRRGHTSIRERTTHHRRS